jgi:predicted DNA-binding antitoxin AbrB/MazE fold protein
MDREGLGCIGVQLAALLVPESSMTQRIEAIYTDGVLKPVSELALRDNQRVRLTVETIDEPNVDRQAAIARLKAGIASMSFFSERPLPSREELHDRR